MHKTAIALLVALAAAGTAAVFATSASHAAAQRGSWFTLAVAVQSSGYEPGFLRGRDLVHPAQVAGYVRVSGTVENTGAVRHSGDVALTLSGPNGTLKVFSLRLTLDHPYAIPETGEFLHGGAGACTTTYHYSTSVAVRMAGLYTATVQATHVFEVNDPTEMAVVAPSVASATALVR